MWIFTFIKYNFALSSIFFKKIGAIGKSVKGLGVSVDGAGSISVIGNFSGDLNTDGVITSAVGANDIFIAQYASDGTIKWVKTNR